MNRRRRGPKKQPGQEEKRKAENKQDNPPKQLRSDVRPADGPGGRAFRGRNKCSPLRPARGHGGEGGEVGFRPDEDDGVEPGPADPRQPRQPGEDPLSDLQKTGSRQPAFAKIIFPPARSRKVRRVTGEESQGAANRSGRRRGGVQEQKERSGGRAIRDRPGDNHTVTRPEAAPGTFSSPLSS